MKAAVVYASYHKKNTERIAQLFARSWNADAFPILRIASLPNAAEYEILAIGSGIYKWSYHPKILKWIDTLPEGHGKPVVLFSTSSFQNEKFNDPVQKTLESKGYEILGRFHSKGSSSFLPSWLLGGMTKDRPNDADMERAQHFADTMNERIRLLKEE